MIDTIELYIWILVWLTLTLIQGHRSARKQKKKFCISYLTKFSIDLDGIWSDEPHTHLISAIQYSRERTLLMWFCWKTPTFSGLYSGIYKRISFRLHVMIETTKSYLRSRSQLYEKSNTSVSIFSQMLQFIWMKFSMWAQPGSLLKLGAQFILHKEYSRERTVHVWSYKIHCPVSGYLWTDLFQTWYDARHD